MMRRILLLTLVAASFTSAALGQSCPQGASWCSGTYGYDGAGNIRSIGSDVYIYDTAGRLVSGTAGGVQNQQIYSYDALGNRTGASRIAGSIDCLGGCELSPPIDTNTNHIGVGAQYDDAGNLTVIQSVVGSTTYTATYTYDTAGRLARAVAGSDVRDFIYTADDERIATANGASWTWTIRGLDGKVLREFTSMVQNGLPTANRFWAKDYVWRDGLLLASVTPTNAGTVTPTLTQHFHLDHLGTPRLVTGDSGVQLGLHTYYPFGAELNLGTNEQPYELMKFTGHERDVLGNDPHTLDDMHARYYSPTVGGFLSVDPVIDTKVAMTNPQAWNRYTYVRNNPTSRIDPDGRCGVPAGLQPGQIGVCVASFIAKHMFFKFGLPGRGDGRTFNGNGGTSRIEARLIIDPVTHTVKKVSDTINRSGLLIKDVGPRGVGGTQVSNVRSDAQGNTHFGVSQDAHSSYSLGGSVFGSIDNHLKLEVTTDGRVGVESALAKDFPSLEVFQYSMDAHGAVTTKQILTKEESENVDDLKEPERVVPPIQQQ
jgi:RHS repeat-associated protein